MRFVPATTHEDHLRPHAPVYGGRGESHALGTELRPDDQVVPRPIARGDCTVHNERVMHGSGGNETDGFRRAYVLAYRSEATVRIERELGFTHSHNDELDVLEDVGVSGETRSDPPLYGFERGRPPENRVRAAFFSFTPPPPPGDDGSYLRWHLLDHMPEQYQLPGIQLGVRYLADADCTGARLVATGDLEHVGNLVNYLVGDPVQETHDDFMALGRGLARGWVTSPSTGPPCSCACRRAWPGLRRPHALISAEVVPFRPHRGVLVVVEEPVGPDTGAWEQWLDTDHHPAVLGTPGVAGVWVYGSTDTWDLHPATQGDPQHTTVIYLDEDPIVTTQALTPLLEERWHSGAVRPRFAGPLRSMIEWEAWR